MQNYSCNNTHDIHELGHLCFDSSIASQYECVKKLTIEVELIRIGSGIWRIVVAVIGIIGNLTTLITVPYAARRKRHGLDKNFYNSTIFILNWSFVNLCHCIIWGIPKCVSLLSKSPQFGEIACNAVVLLSSATNIADLSAFTFIAVTRCINITCGEK